MTDRPLILFANPVPVAKARRYGGATEFYRPTHSRQVERLTPQFNRLQQAIDGGRVRIAQNPECTSPEYTLVLEVAGDPSSFETAVRNTHGIEWLFEVADNDVPNTDDFYRLKNDQRDDSKTMLFKYFCILTDQQALSEILSLWREFKKDENYTFPHGQSGLKQVFKTLNDIHLWGVKERLEETGILDAWYEDLCEPDTTEVKCEIELFFRRSPGKRMQAENSVKEVVDSIGGAIFSVSCIEDIGYHALLVSIPRQYAQNIIDNKNVELVELDQIMFFKPTGQSMVLDTDDGLPYEKAFSTPDNISNEPIIAMFDGLPQERHPLLNDLLLIDDPDDYTSSYQITDRQHGTSMASLIARGDLLSNDESIISHKLYVRPIMKPYPGFRGTEECIPEDILIVDKIHEAVRRLYEPEAGQVASSVRVINLSIGIKARMYYNLVSPLARLLDWLSFKYRVLFIVSAGNHSEDIDLGMSFSAYKALSMDERDKQIIHILDRNSRNYRLLSPAESMNALTVGALFNDMSEATENIRQLLPCSNSIPSPISSIGRGINNSIKPDVIFNGGRSVLFEDITVPNHAKWRNGTSIYPPGTLSAKPITLAGNTNVVGYSFGTSDSAALLSHEAMKCYDVLQEIFQAEQNSNVPAMYAALLLKAMLVHGAQWNSTAQLICKEIGLSGRGADQIHRWLGYGIPNVSRVLECAKNRVTLIGFGELEQDSACLYTLPLPFDFSAKKMYRCLTVTLASFSPINALTQKYRSAQLWFSLVTEGKNLRIKRTDADDKAVARGTLQHERFAGNDAVVWGEDDSLGIQINCRADAGSFTGTIPYALFATFEIAPEYDIDVYQKIAEKVRTKEKIAP